MESNKQTVLKVLKGAFIERDATVVDRYFSPDYVQHNPVIPNGAKAIANLIPTLKDLSYEIGMVVAEGDLVMVHGRYLGWGPKPLVAVDISDGDGSGAGVQQRFPGGVVEVHPQPQSRQVGKDVDVSIAVRKYRPERRSAGESIFHSPSHRQRPGIRREEPCSASTPKPASSWPVSVPKS